MVDSKTVLDARLEKILKEVFQAEKIDLNFSMDEIPEWDSFKPVSYTHLRAHET